MQTVGALGVGAGAKPRRSCTSGRGTWGWRYRAQGRGVRAREDPVGTRGERVGWFGSMITWRDVQTEKVYFELLISLFLKWTVYFSLSRLPFTGLGVREWQRQEPGCQCMCSDRKKAPRERPWVCIAAHESFRERKQLRPTPLPVARWMIWRESINDGSMLWDIAIPF